MLIVEREIADENHRIGDNLLITGCYKAYEQVLDDKMSKICSNNVNNHSSVSNSW